MQPLVHDTCDKITGVELRMSVIPMNDKRERVWKGGTDEKLATFELGRDDRGVVPSMT